jgi:hypothetical protein
LERRLAAGAWTQWLAGKWAPPRSAAEDWQWPPYEFPIPPDWPSAVYIAHLDESGDGSIDLAMSSAAVLFVVRGNGRSKLLYKIPLATYHAYNFTGDGCFYVNPPRSENPPGGQSYRCNVPAVVSVARLGAH